MRARNHTSLSGRARAPSFKPSFMLVRPGYGGEPLRATNFLSPQARVSCEWKKGSRTLGLHGQKRASKKPPWAAECFFGGRLPSAHGRVAEVTPASSRAACIGISPTRQRAALTSGCAKHHQRARAGHRPRIDQHRTADLWLVCDCSDVHRRFPTRSLLGCPSARPSDRPKSLQCASNFSQDPLQKAPDPRSAQARTADCSLVAPHSPDEQLII